MNKLKPKKTTKKNFGSLRNSVHSIRTVLTEPSVSSHAGNAIAAPAK